MEAQPPTTTTEPPPPPPKQSPMSNHHNNHPEMMIIRAQNDGSRFSLPKRGRGRPPKTNNSNTTTTAGEVKDRSDDVILPLTTTEPPPPLTTTEPPPPPKQSPMSNHHNNHSPYAETTIIRAQNDGSSFSLPKRGRGRPPKTNTSSNSNTTTAGGEVKDRSDDVILPAKRGRGRPIAKPKAIPIPKPVAGGGSRSRGRPRKEVITTDAGSGSGSDPAGAYLVPPGMVPGEKIGNRDVPGVISTTASGRPVRRPMKLNVESSAVAPVVNGAVVKPVGSGKPVGRPRKVGSLGKIGVGGGGVVKKTAGRPRKVVGNNLGERVVMLLEESLRLGMNQSVPDMYLRYVQLYTIITGKEYDLAVAGATAQGNNQ